MSTPDPARRPERELGGGGGSFILYVEGPRDRSILRSWAYTLIPGRVRALLAGSVILGGRRPARALAHFRECALGSQAVCVLDRDVGEPPHPAGEAEEGLHFHTWGRRHIESYLLIPAAIRRALALSPSDHRLEAILHAELPRTDDSAAWRALDAKRLLAGNGLLARALGRPLPLARIARATREDELHADVHEVFGRLREGLSRAAGSWRPRTGS